MHRRRRRPAPPPRCRRGVSPDQPRPGCRPLRCRTSKNSEAPFAETSRAFRRSRRHRRTAQPRRSTGTRPAASLRGTSIRKDANRNPWLAQPGRTRGRTKRNCRLPRLGPHPAPTASPREPMPASGLWKATVFRRILSDLRRSGGGRGTRTPATVLPVDGLAIRCITALPSLRRADRRMGNRCASDVACRSGPVNGTARDAVT